MTAVRAIAADLSQAGLSRGGLPTLSSSSRRSANKRRPAALALGLIEAQLTRATKRHDVTGLLARSHMTPAHGCGRHSAAPSLQASGLDPPL